MVRIVRFWLLLCACAVRSDYLPNPETDFVACRRPKSSLVCDPDDVIPFEDAEKLDRLAVDVRRTSQCLCQKCVPGNGVTIAVFLSQNLPNRTAIPPTWDGNDVAKWIREQWRLGECQDDLVIVLITKQNISGFSMGPQLQRILPRDIVNQIFKDCRVHFRFGYYTQGLESIINSLGDVLLRIQKQGEEYEPSKFGLALGIALGVCVFLILILSAVILLWRQTKRKNKSSQKANTFNNTRTRKDKEYHPCKLRDRPSEDEDEDTDSDILYESSRNGKAYTALRTKRQLSDVLEESEEVGRDDDDEASFVAPPPNRSQSVTEL